MSISLPNGTTYAIASAYGTAKPITAITNAAAAVCTSAAHGLTVGAIVEISSGWPSLNGRIARVSAQTTNDFTLEKINTTNTKRHPPGAGVGSVRVITTFTPIVQVLDANASGGDQQFHNFQFVEDVDDERQLPTVRSARQLVLSIADDDTPAHYAVLEAADDDRQMRAIRAILPTGATIYYDAIISFNKTPTMTKNELMALTVNCALQSPPTRYPAAA